MNWRVIIVPLQSSRTPETDIAQTSFVTCKMSAIMSYVEAQRMVRQLRARYKEAGTGEAVVMMKTTMINVIEEY